MQTLSPFLTRTQLPPRQRLQTARARKRDPPGPNTMRLKGGRAPCNWRPGAELWLPPAYFFVPAQYFADLDKSSWDRGKRRFWHFQCFFFRGARNVFCENLTCAPATLSWFVCVCVSDRSRCGEVRILISLAQLSRSPRFVPVSLPSLWALWYSLRNPLALGTLCAMWRSAKFDLTRAIVLALCVGRIALVVARCWL